MSLNQHHLSSMPLTNLGFQALSHKGMLLHNINPSALPDEEAVTQGGTSVDEPRCLIHCASKVANDFTGVAFSLELLVLVDARQFVGIPQGKEAFAVYLEADVELSIQIEDDFGDFVELAIHNRSSVVKSWLHSLHQGDHEAGVNGVVK